MKTRYSWSTVAASPRPKTVPVALLATSGAGAERREGTCILVVAVLRGDAVAALGFVPMHPLRAAGFAPSPVLAPTPSDALILALP